jgi:hypothetical protein
MWLFTTIGFFSVVAHRDDPGTILIRARVREDLDSLRRHHLPDLEITDAAGTYAFEALVSRDEWEHAAQQLSRSVDYTDDAAMQRLQSVASGNSSLSSAADDEHHLG